MFCQHCGKKVQDNSNFCEHCGEKIDNNIINYKNEYSDSKKGRSLKSVTLGYSSKINDPAFKKYLKSTNRYSFYFSVILAVIAIIGFYIYGETSYEMDNPEALYIGLGIGAMFIIIALFQILGRKRSKTWDGIVVKKEILDRERKVNTGNNDYYIKRYKVYNVVVYNEHGKAVDIRTEDDDTVYNYYEVGDKVRHHGGLNSYEKYDKTKDTIIFCNACGTLNNINEDNCHRCNCPLLK